MVITSLEVLYKVSTYSAHPGLFVYVITTSSYFISILHQLVLYSLFRYLIWFTFVHCASLHPTASVGIQLYMNIMQTSSSKHTIFILRETARAEKAEPAACPAYFAIYWPAARPATNIKSSPQHAPQQILNPAPSTPHNKY